MACAVGCVGRLRSCDAFDEPEVTGVSDDGLWFYLGGERYRSDMITKQELIPSVEIDGVTYEGVRVNDTVYRGDEVYMCASYYTDEQQEDYAGGCIIKYNAFTKEYAVLYNGEDVLEEIEFVSNDGASYAIWSDFDVLLISNGAVVDVLYSSGISFFYSEDYIAYFVDGTFDNFVRYKMWADDDWIRYDVENGSYIEGNVANLLFIKTVCEIDNLDYYCTGIYVFDMSAGQGGTLVDPEDGQSCKMDVQSGFYVVGTVALGVSGGEAVVYKRDCAIYRFNLSDYYNYNVIDGDLIAAFAESDVNFTDYISDNGSYIRFSGYDINGKSHIAYFDKETWQFIDESALPEYEVLAAYGDYEFYCRYNPSGFMSSYGYHALHRVNKVTQADEVMAVLYGAGSYEPYQFDLVSVY